MRKTLSILVTGLLLLASTSCAKREPSLSGEKDSKAAKTKPVDEVNYEKPVSTEEAKMIAEPGQRDSKVPKMERVHLVIDDNTVATKDVETIMEPLWLTANRRGSYTDYESSLAKFSRGQRLILAVSLYSAEVDNGGHEQFYFNSSGIVWEDAQKGLSEIGVPEVAKIMAESAKRMGGRPSFDRQERRGVLEQRNPNFDDLDDRYSELDVDLDAKMLEYIRAHPKEFLFDGEIEREGRP